MSTLLRQGFGLNTDLFETNILNLAVVFSIVIKIVGDSLKTLLKQRRKTILSTLKEVDQKAIEAEQQLKEAKRELEAARLRCKEIQDQTVQSIERENSLAQKQLEKDLCRLQERRNQIIQLERQRTLQSISKKISDIALISAENRLLKGFKLKGTSNSKQKELNELYIRETFCQLKSLLYLNNEF
jgi:F-type H+-transporting ATPase subunit b